MQSVQIRTSRNTSNRSKEAVVLAVRLGNKTTFNLSKAYTSFNSFALTFCRDIKGNVGTCESLFDGFTSKYLPSTKTTRIINKVFRFAQIFANHNI